MYHAEETVGGRPLSGVEEHEVARQRQGLAAPTPRQAISNLVRDVEQWAPHVGVPSATRSEPADLVEEETA